MRKITSFALIPRLRGYLLEKIRKQPENRYSSFGVSLFFFSREQISTLFNLGIFFFLLLIYSSNWPLEIIVEIFLIKNHLSPKMGLFIIKNPLKNAFFNFLP